MGNIVLSMGHDAKRPGAVHEGVTEHMLCMELWQRIQYADSKLDGRITVIDGTLKEAVSEVNALSPVLAAELHFNSFAGGTAQGCETLYYPKSKAGKLISRAFQSQYVLGMGSVDRGVKEGWYRMKTNGTVDYFLRKTRCPSMILEPEFIQVAYNWDDEDLMNVATHIVVGLYAAYDAIKE